MRTIVVAGASGLIGRAIHRQWDGRGWRILSLVRPDSSSLPLAPGEKIPWQPERSLLDAQLLAGCDAVIHLSGANIGSGRWTKKRKRVLRDSRLKTTRVLCSALARLPKPPACLICASAVGYYGDCGDFPVRETTPPGDGFLAEVCQAWEAACKPAIEAGIRVIHARLGIVIAAEGGALASMLTPFRFGLGGKFGNGRQYWSWISLADVIRAFEFCLDQKALRGPVNFTSPVPVTNKRFTKTLAKCLSRPALLSIPRWPTRFILGEMADELFFQSCRAMPTVLMEAGFSFEHETLAVALAANLTEI